MGYGFLTKAVRSPTTSTFIPLALIRDGFVIGAGDSPIRFSRVMFSKKISVLSKIFLVNRGWFF
jgi:hypothetical protein